MKSRKLCGFTTIRGFSDWQPFTLLLDLGPRGLAIVVIVFDLTLYPMSK